VLLLLRLLLLLLRMTLDRRYLAIPSLRQVRRLFPVAGTAYIMESDIQINA
jgi:hypothetical protein